MSVDLHEACVSLTVSVDEARVLFRVLESLRFGDSGVRLFRLDHADGVWGLFSSCIEEGPSLPFNEPDYIEEFPVRRQ